MADTTSATLSPLPSSDELAWLDHLTADATSKVLQVVEHLERAFSYEEIEDGGIRPRVEFEPMTLEQLGSYLLLSRELHASAGTLTEYAERLASAAHGLYNEHEDIGRGVVTGVAGIESYLEYRQRIADGYAAAAADARGVVDNLTPKTG